MNVENNGPENSICKNFTEEEYWLMEEDFLHPVKRIGRWGKIWIFFLIVICLAGIYAYYIQETRSKYVTISLRDYTMWGVYISNFVFFVALSLIGVLVSAVFKLTHFEWYRPLSRIAEVIAMAAILVAGVSIVAAMGRPDRLYFIITHGRIQSPIVWDIIVILTYIAITIVFIFIPMIPSMALYKEHFTNIPKWQRKIYTLLSFGWEGSEEQRKILKKVTNILTVMIIPVGISIHTVTAWLFATTLRSEWDSTNFGVYFVSGAFLLSIAGMIIAVFVFRKAYKLEHYLTEMHFDKLGKALVFLSLVYIYFNINEYLVPSYKMDGLHENHLLNLFIGDEAFLYWTVVIFGMVVPALLPLIKKFRKPLPLTLIALSVVIAAWFKRYLIVIPGLSHPYLPIQDVPDSWKHYSPSLIEMTIVTATFAALLLIITLFSRFFPIISVWEVTEGRFEGKKEIINYEK